MIIVLFRSRLTPETGDDYAEMSAEMDRLARSSPGFVDVKSYKAEDGERLTLVWWQDEETLQIWRQNVRHLVAQKTGREKWYEYYKSEVATIIRTSNFERQPIGVR
ncbi:MAG: antibiotic biosynthesis monooxygenase [Bryobacteraceae bacterium]